MLYSSRFSKKENKINIYSYNYKVGSAHIDADGKYQEPTFVTRKQEHRFFSDYRNLAQFHAVYFKAVCTKYVVAMMPSGRLETICRLDQLETGSKNYTVVGLDDVTYHHKKPVAANTHGGISA